MKPHFYRLSLLGSVLGALTLNIALADDFATHEIEPVNITVSFNRLDLANSAGLDSLYQRIESAAREVCDADNFKFPLDIARKNRECVASSINNAIEEIGDARLTALYQSKFTTDHQS